jgi:DNA-binding XRE family transcriptional regulator
VYIKTMKSKTLRKYIKFRELSISQAAQEIGISRQTLYEALNGRPLGKRAALKIEDWSEGFLLAADLAGLNRDRETVQ